MTQIYNIVSIVAFTLAGVFFLVSIFLWFKFGIWEIIGDLSGRNAKKSIQQMRRENDKTGAKMYHPNGFGGKSGNTEISVHMNSTKNTTSDLAVSKTKGLTGKMKKTDSLVSNETEVLQENETELLQESATELLVENETALLGENETELLSNETVMLENETALLQPEMEEAQMETSLLGEVTGELPRWGNPVQLTLLQNIVFIHTDEQI